MKTSYFILGLFFSVSSLFAQSAVQGKLVLKPSHKQDFIARNTRVILQTKTACDTVTVNDSLVFFFPKAESGRAYLYLDSPILTDHVKYKFHIRKNKPTEVSLRYEKFETPMIDKVISPEEREAFVEAGLAMLRLTADLLIILGSAHH